MNSILGPNDSGMLAVLEASLPAMNQQVIDSIARARNAPPPAPAAPGSRKFLRLLVDASVDTDSDGSPDWAEFEIAASGTGMLVPGVTGDAFNADTNEDGTPDGDQTDRDGDGTPDAQDPDPSDNTTVVPLGPLPRYALFEIPGNAIQINDLGTVIFPEKVWKGGILAALPGGGADAPQGSARSINDLDVILGTVGTRPDLPDHPSSVIGKVCYWPTPTSTYETIHVMEDGVTVDAYRQHNGIYQQGPGHVLTNSGHFIAHADVEDPPEEYSDAFDWNPTLWQIPIGTAGSNRRESQSGAVYLSSPSLMWGTLFPRPANGNQGLVYTTAALPSIPFVPLNVISQPLPKGGVAIFATPPLNLFGNPNSLISQVYVDGQWRENELYANAIDIAGDGTAIGRNEGGKVAPILLNGQWTGIERTAPGLPQAWKEPFVKLTDTTPRGWVLGRDTVNSKSAVLLPIRAEGQFNDQFGKVIKTATGVDDTSIGSIDPGQAVSDRIWIMAPKDGPAKTVTFKAPLNPATALKLSAAGVDLGGTGGSATLTAPETLVSITAGTAATGTDIPLDLNFGNLASLSKPLGVKVMKKRTVKVMLYKVTKITPNKPDGTPVADNTADQTPDATELEKELNDIYLPQLNLSFEVRYAPAPIAVDWDRNPILPSDPAAGNGQLDVEGATLSIEQRYIFGRRPTPLPESDIDVFLIGTDKYIDATAWASTLRIQDTGAGAAGQVNACWVAGDALDGRTMEKLKNTIAHELGHVLVGYGHPDKDGGPAILPGTDHKQRMLCSGLVRNKNGFLFVKDEWDEAEVWLTKFPDKRVFDATGNSKSY